jgi:uncharacterized FlaG/YvyC family protein
MDISSINSAVNFSVPTDAGSPRPVSPDQRHLIQAVKAVNGSELFGQENEVTFIVDRVTRRPVVRIVNRKSGQVVDQIPAEYVLRLAEELKRS